MATLTEAMQAAGWRYDAATDGYRKRGLWVLREQAEREQAERALAAAERGEDYAPALGASETIARAIGGGGANDA